MQFGGETKGGEEFGDVASLAANSRAWLCSSSFCEKR